MKSSANIDKRLFGVGVLAALALLAALAAPIAFGRVYVADDLGAFHLPTRAFYSDCLKNGFAFDWWPAIFNGFYLTGEGQAGTYHPLHLVIYKWLPLQLAFGLELWLNYAFLLMGGFLWMRNHIASRGAALFGAIVFAFSGFCMLHFVHVNAIAVVAHMPWLLFCIDRTCRAETDMARASAVAAVSLLTASQLLLGYPQYVWYSLLAEAIYLVLVLCHQTTRSAIATLFLAKLTGLLIGAVQWLPTIEALRNSTRHVADATFLETGSFHPLNVVQIVAPYLFQNRVVGQNTHELGFYIGAVPITLFVWLLGRRVAANSHLGILRFAGVISALAFLLALGSYGPLYKFHTLLPVVGNFRFPARMIVLIHLSMAAVSAVAFAELMRTRADCRAPAKWPIVLPTLCGIFVLGLGVLFWRSHLATWPLVLLGPVLLAVAAWLLHTAQQGRRWAMAGLVLFAAADLGFYGFSYSAMGETAELQDLSAPPATLPAGRGSRVVFSSEANDSESNVGNRITMTGVRRVGGYVGLFPVKHLDYNDLSTLRIAGAEWYGTIDSSDKRSQFQFEPIDRPFPEYRFVTQAILGSPHSSQIRDLDFESAALVERPLVLPPGRPGKVEIVRSVPGTIQLKADVPMRQLLVVAQSYHPGWRARIDDVPAAVWRANGDFLACVVPAGRHDVRLSFEPASLRIGMTLSLCGLGLLVCSFFATSVAGRRK